MNEPWIKLQRNLTRHPRAAEAGATAMWLYIGGLTYCDEFATDGRIAAAALYGLTTTHRQPEKDAAQLVKVGLWSKDGDYYVVERYLDKNRSAAQIEEQRAKASLAGKKSAAKRVVNGTPNEPLNVSLNRLSTEPPTEREVEKETPKALPLPAEAGIPDFEDFWSEYPAQPNGTKPEKKKAHDQWVKLPATEKRQAASSLPNYSRHLQQMDISAKYAERYLRDRTFRDFQSAPLELVGGKPAPKPLDWAKLQRESQQAAERAAGLA